MKEDIKVDVMAGRPGSDCPECGVADGELHLPGCPRDRPAGRELFPYLLNRLKPTGDYAKLELVLDRALAQASGGKGKERHAVEGEPFERQQICEITRRLGHGFSRGQAVKKIYEAQRLPQDRAVAELLGAINYIVASIIVLEEGS